MKKLIALILCLCAATSVVQAQLYYCQPYYGDNKIRFYTTTNPVAGSPFYTLDLSADVTSAWGVTATGPNDVLIFGKKVFVSFDLGDRGGVLIYNLSDVYPARNGNPPIVIKPQTTNGLQSAGITINPANGDLYVPTFNDGTDDSGVYQYTAASNYATGSQFASYNNDNSVAQVCANLAFDKSGNLWMTTWTEDDVAAHHFLICYKGLNKNNYYKITNTATPTYSATDVNGTAHNGLNLLSAPEGIAFDPSGNLWLGNNNDFALTNGAGQGTLVKFSSTWISTLLSSPSTGTGTGNPTYSPTSAQATIQYIANGKLGGVTFNGNTIYLNDQGQNQGSSYTANGTVWQWDATTAFNATDFKASGIHTIYPGNGGGAILALAPTISYSSPQTYTVGTAITSLAPTSSGVAALAYTSPAGLGSGFSLPTGIAVDAVGNLYVADAGNNAVKKMPAGGGSPVAIGSGFNDPNGVAVDATGNVYVADYGNNAVKKILMGGGAPLVLGSGFSHPTGVAVDASGNVYVADSGNGLVKMIAVNGGVVTTLGSGFTTPSGVAVDAAGNVYVADLGNSTVKEIPFGGGALVTIGSGFNGPFSVAVSGGNLYIADAGNNAIKVVPAAGGTPVTIGSGFNSPSGVTADAEGNVYVADQLHNAVKQIKPTGGYFISGLPAGLIFNNSTGVISGTPTAGSPLTVYTINAYNGSGSATTTLTITVNAVTISYGSPKTYTAGTKITELAPTGSGVAAPAYSGSTMILGSGFSVPIGVALDAAGNVYVADYGNNAIKMIPVGGGPPVTLASGIASLNGLAADAAGDVYFVAAGASEVMKIPAGGGTPVSVGSTGGTPRGVAIDASGNIYATNSLNQVVKIPATGGGAIFLAAGFSSPYGLALDGAGNIYVADYGNNAIKKIPVAGGPMVTLGSGFSLPSGVVVDGAGNVFVADYNNYAIKEIPAGGGAPINIASGFNDPFGVALDAAGNIYVADDGNSAVKKIKPVGGYFINTFLPLGLSFANTTGVISGTPTTLSPATNYTITGYNASGFNSANLTIKVNLPAIPTISYSSPQAYPANIAITPLAPTSSGVAAFSYSNSTVNLGSGAFSNTGAVAVDAAGNLYVVDVSTDLVKMIPAGGGAPVNYGSGYSSPSGVAVDAAGNIYVANNGNHTVIKIPMGGGAPVTLSASFSDPFGVAVDAAGNVFVADAGNNTVMKLPAGGGAPVSLGSGFKYPYGVAVDAAGNVYVADGGNNAVKEIPVGGGAPVVLGSGFKNPSGVAVDASGNVYVADNGNRAIKRIPAGGGSPVSLGSGFSPTQGVTVDGSGNVYVADYGSDAIKEVKPVGGYFISGSLPAGLSFATATGVISGTPTALSAAKNYIITAYNYGGSAAAAVSIKVDALNISYSSPQTYLENAAITALTPISVGVAAFGFNTTASTIGSGFSHPTGVASGSEAYIYIADFDNHAIKKMPSGGGATVIVGSGFAQPFGVAVDAAGNVYVADYGNNAVKKIPVGGGAPITLGSGFNLPYGVAVDAAGNVYVADLGDNTVKKIPFGVGSPVTIGSGFTGPTGVAVDGAGNVYVADGGKSTITKIPVGGGSPVAIGSGFSTPYGVAVDAAGNVYVADYGNNAVKMIPAGGGSPITIGAGYSVPTGVAVGPAGNIYVADQGNNAIKKIKPLGGYFLNSFLPVGLTFSSTTGAISGTPTVVSAAKNYTVNAYNSLGSNSATVKITVTSHDADLSKLVISAGTLTPAFAAATTSYTASVGNATMYINITPTFDNNSAAGTVNGTGIVSGTTSASLPLAIGPNAITTVITAPDGTTTKTYTVTVTRAPSAVATLSALKLNGGTLAPAFAAGTTSYTASVANGVSSITVTPTTSDATATIKVNGAAVTSGATSAAISLNVGSNTITTIVTAQDGTTTKTYTVKVTRAPSAIATLSALKISSGTLTPAFASGTISYTASVANTVTSITLTPTTSDATATVKVNGSAVTSGTASAAINLNVGSNTITTVVTAQDGTTTKTYTTTVTRSAASSLATLSALKISSGALTPAFASGTTSYTASVANGVSSITVTPTASDINSTITVNGTTVTSGVASQSLPLVVGPNIITIVVTAQDGTTKTTYTITVTEGPSSNAGLSNITLSSGSLNPAFSTATTSYTAGVANYVSTITITPTTTDANATVKVNGTLVTSGTASGPVTLAEGAQTVITTVVTAQDGTTAKTYTVTVTRAPSSNANLSSIGSSAPGLTPAFSSATTGYTISVGNATASMTVKPVTSDANATLKINGTATASGTVFGPVALTAGAQTVISIAVMAQDGTTTKTYTLTVTRAAGGADSYDPGISVTKPTETPALAEDGIQVHQGVSPNGDGINDFLQIDNISQYPDNKLSIMNRNGQLVFETQGYDNSSKVFDGHSNKNGQMQLPGTYFYQLVYTVNGITKHKTGFIVLKY